jgi:hypothetical protein
MDHPKLAAHLVNASHCSHLRHKGMYVTSAPDPDERTFYDAYDWCTCTQKARGPDGGLAHPDSCSDGRACCEH